MTTELSMTFVVKSMTRSRRTAVSVTGAPP